jgi:hypothetical protein
MINWQAQFFHSARIFRAGTVSSPNRHQVVTGLKLCGESARDMLAA